MAANTLGFKLDKMPNVDKLVLFSGMSQRSWLPHYVYYIIDSKYRKGVNLAQWFKDWEATKPTMVLPNFGPPSDECALQCTRWVAQNIKYVGDMQLWNMDEHWETPDVTLSLGKGDCEAGAMLLYIILRAHGFSDDQVKIVAGPVKSPGMLQPAGHCYVSYISSESAIEYTLDWCFVSYDSLLVPYGINRNYLLGSSEWFAFNLSGSYVRK